MVRSFEDCAIDKMDKYRSEISLISSVEFVASNLREVMLDLDGEKRYVNFFFQESAEVFKEILESETEYLMIYNLWDPKMSVGYYDDYHVMRGEAISVWNEESETFIALGELIGPERNRRIYKNLLDKIFARDL